MNCVLFAKMDQVFSKENKTLKKYWKIGKKYWKSQGILSVWQSGNPGFWFETRCAFQEHGVSCQEDMNNSIAVFKREACCSTAQSIAQ